MDQIGKYEVLDKIGSGGFAVVYKGYDPFIKRPVAIKVCYSRDAETRERFNREAQIAGRLVHRNITAIYDFGLHDQNPYLVEEYLPGEDLAHMIRRREPETLLEKLEYLLQIADGLGYAHSQNVIHRDIKPSNIRILNNGRVKIMDFGTAKLANVESNLTQTGMTLGTVAYLSPERLLGKPSGTNSDIFSYGVLAYELLSFRRPFAGHNIPNLIDQVLNATPVPLQESWPQCPESLAVMVHRCLTKDPAERYASCQELSHALEQVRKEHCAFTPEPPAEPPVADRTQMRLTGLLEHARELQSRGKLQRAEVLLDEVLEIDPGNTEARELLAASPAAELEGTATIATPTGGATHGPNKAMWEEPADRRRRKIGEAVTVVEQFVEAGELVRATEALKFATEFLGPFVEASALKRRIVEALRLDVTTARESGMKEARHMVAAMADLRGRNLLPIEVARNLVERIGELDPDDIAGRHILAALHQDANQRRPEVDDADRTRKKQDAIDSIERLLAGGDPATAEKALRFAVRLFGEFDQIPQLEQRISQALRESQG
ncbi:MAG: protein kinase [bacterium]|nr:protein kinase [bacterium]